MLMAAWVQEVLREVCLKSKHPLQCRFVHTAALMGIPIRCLGASALNIASSVAVEVQMERGVSGIYIFSVCVSLC